MSFLCFISQWCSHFLSSSILFCVCSVGRCMVLWSDSLCNAGGSIPIWGPRGSKKFPENHQCNLFFMILMDRFIKGLLFLTLHILIQRIMAVQYKIPDYVHISQDCRHLLSRIFVANPARVCTCCAAYSASEFLFIKFFLKRNLVKKFKALAHCVTWSWLIIVRHFHNLSYVIFFPITWN